MTYIATAILFSILGIVVGALIWRKNSAKLNADVKAVSVTAASVESTATQVVDAAKKL